MLKFVFRTEPLPKMRYSEDTVQAVISQNDIVDVVGMYVHLTKKGANYFGLCPFHGEKTASFSVSPRKQMYYCFGCHKGGGAATFLMDYENISFPEAIELLAQRVGYKLPESTYSNEDEHEQSLKKDLYRINRDAANYFYMARKSPRGEIAENYFKKRGLNDETIKHFALGYSYAHRSDLYEYLKNKGYSDETIKESGLVTFSEKGVTDKFFNRAMFPIVDERDRVIGFGGRVMGDGEPKYLNSPETRIFNKGSNLYALNFAKKSRKDYLILCEGYMDVISLHRAGFTCAVASLGTALTDKNALKISRYVKKVYLTYDSDAAGVNASLRAIPLLTSHDVSVKVISTKPYKDPDEFIRALGAEEFEKRIQNAESSFFFEIGITESKYNLNDPEEKTRFLESVVKRLLQFENGLTRDTYKEAFTRRYNIDPKKFDSLLVDVAGKTGKNPDNSALWEQGDYYGNPFTGEQNENPKYVNRNKRTYNSDGGMSYGRKEENTLNPADEGLLKAERLLLTYISDYPEIFKKVSRVLSPKDFFSDIYVKVAEYVYSELTKNVNINASNILNLFYEKEEQETVAEIFQTEIPGELTTLDAEKAVEDIVRQIKIASVKRETAECVKNGNGARMTELIREEASLKNRTKKLF